MQDHPGIRSLERARSHWNAGQADFLSLMQQPGAMG